MNRLWAPFVVMVLLAPPTTGGLACSRSSLGPARPDGSAERPRSDAQVDHQVPADAAPSDPGSPSCGNGQLDPGEACDDGNTRDGDGCTEDCKLDCATCRGLCPGCPPRRDHDCGNGRLAVDEACDDGNETSGDGCSGDCRTVEAGFRCPKPGAACMPICGDGLLVGWESLLDAEPSCNAGDQPGSICGDGQVTRYEECDCGNDAVSFPITCIGPNDGSYGNCTFGCTWGPFCGDGIVNIPDEECDLGALNGVRLDQEGKPSNHPDALVVCSTDCTITLRTH